MALSHEESLTLTLGHVHVQRDYTSPYDVYAHMHTDRTSNLIGFPFNSMLNHAVGIVVGWYANFIRPVLVR